MTGDAEIQRRCGSHLVKSGTIHIMEHRETLEKDPHAAERTCANEVCGCTIAPDAQTDFCSEYCSGEGVGRGDGACQCGHIPCA